MRELIRDIVHADGCWVTSGIAALSFVLCCVEHGKDRASFEEWRTFLESTRNSNQEVTTCLLYERCLWARDELNFGELKTLSKYLDGPDPVWKFRRAMLLCDLGDVVAARVTIEKALYEIRERFYRDRDSLWILSRLAWVQFHSRGVRSWDSSEEIVTMESDTMRLRFFETKCDPWDTVLAIETPDSIRRLEEIREAKEILFEPGKYRDHSSAIRFTSRMPRESIYQSWRNP